jgi:hypothetical protein
VDTRTRLGLAAHTAGDTAAADLPDSPQRAAARSRWARLLARIYEVFPLTCPVAGARGDMEQLAEINEKYSIDMKMESVPELCERFGLTFPEMEGAGNAPSSPVRPEHG